MVYNKVYKGKSHLEMGDDWGYPYSIGNHHIIMCCFIYGCCSPSISELQVAILERLK